MMPHNKAPLIRHCCGQTDTPVKAYKGDLIAASAAECLRFMKTLKTLPAFGRGWQKRVDDVETVHISYWLGGVYPSAPTPQAQRPTPMIPQSCMGLKSQSCGHHEVVFRWGMLPWSRKRNDALLSNDRCEQLNSARLIEQRPCAALSVFR